MRVNVTFHDKIEDQLRAQGFDLEPLRKDLIGYFESNKRKRPSYLGKDAPYTRPYGVESCEIHHVHVYIDGVSCPQTWKDRKTSDACLVYTFGFFDEESYFVMDFLSKEAHERSKANNYSLITTYKVIAEDFRMKF